MTIQRNGQYRVNKGAIKNDNPEKRATPDTQDLLKVFTKKTKPNHVTKKLICFCVWFFAQGFWH